MPVVTSLECRYPTVLDLHRFFIGTAFDPLFGLLVPFPRSGRLRLLSVTLLCYLVLLTFGRGGVPVIMLLMFQQPVPSDSGMVLQFSSSTDSRTSSYVTETGTHSANCEENLPPLCNDRCQGGMRDVCVLHHRNAYRIVFWSRCPQGKCSL